MFYVCELLLKLRLRLIVTECVLMFTCKNINAVAVHVLDQQFLFDLLGYCAKEVMFYSMKRRVLSTCGLKGQFL